MDEIVKVVVFAVGLGLVVAGFVYAFIIARKG